MAPLPQSTPSKMKWDGVADQQLLLAILATHTIVLDHNAIARRIGPHCSARAVTERIKKLRKISRDNGFDKDGEGYDPKPPKATASNRKRKNITPDDTPSPKKTKARGNKVMDDSEESHEDVDVAGTRATNPGPSEISAGYECEERENTEKKGNGAYGAENTHQEGFVKKEPPSLVPELAIDGFAYEPLNLYGHHDDMLIPFTNED